MAFILYVFLFNLMIINAKVLKDELIPVIISDIGKDVIFPRNGIPIIHPFGNEDDLEFKQNGGNSAGSIATTSASSFYLQSPGYPKTIVPGSVFKWQIERNSSAVCRLKLQYDSFDIESTDMCVADVMILSSNGVNSPQCGLKTGQILYVNFPISQQNINITFSDNGSGPMNPGLQILVTQVIDSCTGSGVANNQKFYIESKDFRKKNIYENNLDQTWTIARNSTSVCKLRLEFKTFVLQNPVDNVCNTDYLEYTDHHIKRRLCGKIGNNTIRTVSWPKEQRDYVINFKTDGTETARGFSLLIEQMLNSC